MKVSAVLKLASLLAFILCAVYFLRFTDIGQSITPARFKEFVESFDPVWAPLLYIVIYIAGTVLLLPGTILSFSGAILFGAYLGTLYTWIGATIGATLAFLAAKFLGRGFVDQLLKGKLQTLDARLGKHGFSALLILRLVPLFPFNGLNFGCGLTSIRWRDYVLATAIGILPGTFVYQLLFARFGEKILQEGFAWSDLLDWQIGIALALFAVFIVIGKWASTKVLDP
ncbi:MAG: TVP38/TMEM64 family protein [Planctomycetes bacterium]|nr:TVP38/TMEM64 family protein [Planctomycetota bacterium]